MAPTFVVSPRTLQAVLDHGRRFAARLAQLEPIPAPHGLARAWLAGRAQEIETVLGSLLGDWRAARLTTQAAASAAAAYLRALHEGLHARIGLDPVQPCCRVGDDDDEPTYFDPRALLLGLDPPPQPIRDISDEDPTPPCALWLRGHLKC